jgi:biopolymer transport protein ExbB
MSKTRTTGACLLVRIGFAVLLVSLLPATASAWWNTSWGLRRKITFNNSGQPTNLNDFPVLVRLDNTRVEYFRTQNLGQDIRFVDADDTTLLSHELWNEAGSSYVWVRVPQVTGGSSTDFIWMYYGSSTSRP